MSDNALTTPDNGGKATGIYILYLMGFVTGGLTTLIGLIMAYVFRDGQNPWLDTHYTNAISIFWKSIAMVLLGVGAIIVFAILILTIPLIVAIAIGLGIVMPIWFIVRCVKGLNYVSKGEEYPTPHSWGF